MLFGLSVQQEVDKSLHQQVLGWTLRLCGHNKFVAFKDAKLFDNIITAAAYYGKLEENSSPKIAVFFHYIKHFGLPLAQG